MGFLMYTNNYDIGDLIKLSPADVVFTFCENDCEAGPSEYSRFGLAVEDNVVALLIDKKEAVEYGGELVFLVGNSRCYMTYEAAGRQPYLNVITISDKEKEDVNSNGRCNATGIRERMDNNEGW